MPVPVHAPTPASSPEPDPTTPAPAASMPVAASSPEPASTPAAVPSTPVVQIDVYGDDGVAGFTVSDFGMWSTITPNEPQSLQTLLQAQLNDSGISVNNRASGGSSSSLKNELAGMDGEGAPASQRLAQSPASIVIEGHSLNDFYGGESVNDYAGYLGQWIQDARAAGKTPVLEEPSPVCDGNHPFLAQYVTAIDSAAQQYGVALIKQYDYISSVTGWCSHLAQGFYPDAYIAQLKAKQERAVIAPLVKAAMK